MTLASWVTLEPVNEGEARLAQTAPLPLSFLNREWGDRDTDNRYQPQSDRDCRPRKTNKKWRNYRECKGSLITAVINRLVRLKVTNLLPFMISWKTVNCTALVLGRFWQYWYISSLRIGVPIEIVIIMFAFSTLYWIVFSEVCFFFCYCCCCFFVLADLFSSFVSYDEPRSQSRVQGTAGFFWELSEMGVKVAWFGEVSLWEYTPEGKLAGWFEGGGESLRGKRFLFLRKQFMYQNVRINCSRSSIPHIFAPPPFISFALTPPPPPHTHTPTHTRLSS